MNVAQIHRFSDLDFLIKSIYFALNFNNLENQGGFMIEYFDRNAKNNHYFSKILSNSIKEVFSYSK